MKKKLINPEEGKNEEREKKEDRKENGKLVVLD